MAKLKKYTSFDALKLDEKRANDNQPYTHIFSEFESFVKELRKEYSNKKKSKTNDGKQPE
jgi:hypothetical protein